MTSRFFLESSLFCCFVVLMVSASFLLPHSFAKEEYENNFTTYSASKLEYQKENNNYQVYTYSNGYRNYYISYEISDIKGAIKDIEADCNANAMILAVDIINPTAATTVTIDFPREFFENIVHGEFIFMLVDGEESYFDQEHSPETYTVVFEMDEKGFSEIEIIGGIIAFQYNPEYHYESRYSVPHYCLLSPKQQVDEGIETKDVFCKDSLMLILKSIDGSPACVKPKTVEKLIERRWA